METGLNVTPEIIEQYLQARLSDGLSASTIQSYRAKLNHIFEYLPDGDKTIYKGTIRSLADTLRGHGYSVQATNVMLSAADSFVTWCQRPELQACMRLDKQLEIQPEITRTEYLRLLSTTRVLGKERDYLIIKTIVLIGVNVSELIAVTFENVERGWVISGEETRRIPEALRQELLAFAKREGIVSGYMFRGNGTSAMSRTGVTKALNSLAEPSQVDEKKCNPRCLRRLYQETQAQFEKMMQALVDQAQELMLEGEQRLYGWGA